MSLEFLRKLSNCDSIASNEYEVRKVLLNELKKYSDEVLTDNLGSIIFKKKGIDNGPKIMISAHIDEVGFIVRSIADNGLIMLMEVGGIKEFAKFMQIVRITTDSGAKIKGILNATFKDNKAENLYVDIGVKSYDEVRSLGIEVGDMVTYDSEFNELNNENIIGKAFDDRLGCYVIGEVLKKLDGKKNHPNTIYFVGTSSEEVGIRGAKTAAEKINPDIVFVIDAACYSDEFNRNYKNKRQISEGIILTNFDKTLVPNREMISIVKKASRNLNKKIQLDMFTNGGTDGGEAHKIFGGKPTVVTCLPLRYGHCAYSIANLKDVNDMIDIYIEIINNFDNEQYEKTIDFLGGVNNE